MKYKIRRIISFLCAVLVLFAFLTSKPRTVKAEPITVATAVIWSVASLLSSLGVGMAIDEDFRNDVITGVKNIPQWGAENLAKIQTAYMGAAGLAVATIGGRDYIQLKLDDLSLASSMLKNQLPNTIQYTENKLSMSGYDHIIDSVYEYKRYSYSQPEYLYGKWYVYDDIKANPYEDRTETGIKNLAAFIYQYESSDNWSGSGSSSVYSAFLVEMGSPCYDYFVQACATKYTHFLTGEGIAYDAQDNRYTGCVGKALPLSASTITNNVYAIDFESNFQKRDTSHPYISIPCFCNGATTHDCQQFISPSTGGTVYTLSSDLGLDDANADREMSMSNTKALYGEVAKILDQLLKDNPDLANDVISVPVDDDTIGNDLPGLLAMLKQLDVNSAQGVQDLITAIERALAKADAEAIATAGTLTGIAQGVTTMTGDIADVKEKVKELTDAMAEEVELDMDKMKITTSLATRFPFCIPFDLASAFSSLGGLPRTAPSWTLPWTVDGTTASIELDLAEFEEWAKVIRWGTLITFNIGLILVTRKLIKG